MKLAIYNHGIEFDGSTPFKQPLGGSESGIVYMARELARCGHGVTVYCNCPNTGDYDAVTYLHYHDFFAHSASMPWDALISFRSFDPFLLGRVAPRMIFWTGDACDQPSLKHFGHRSLQDNVDRVFCVSNWHRETFIKAFHISPEKVIATRNGFCPELVTSGVSKQWTRAAYTSTPFRGLDILVKMFPHMPLFSLDIFSSMKVYGWSSEEDRRVYGSLYEAANKTGVTWHGSVAQPLLLAHLAQIGLFLYPNTFDETSCIAAIEAQASGCVAVTSAKAALNETIENGTTGICLKGDPQSAAYQREFIATVTGLVNNQERLEALSRAARDRAFRKYTWAAIAREWTAILESMPVQSIHARWNGPLTLLQKTHEYLRNGNVNAASRVLTALDQTPFLRNEVEALKGKLNTWM